MKAIFSSDLKPCLGIPSVRELLANKLNWKEKNCNNVIKSFDLLYLLYTKQNQWCEWMNECLTTPQHEKQIGYWVSEKGKCMKWLCN